MDKLVQQMDYEHRNENELLQPTTWIILADIERTEDTECI